jgi:hypothetical protein
VVCSPDERLSDDRTDRPIERPDTQGFARHYARIGVLRPAETDERNGYRRYDRNQVERARQIRVLRELKAPLDEIPAILDDPERNPLRCVSMPTGAVSKRG